MKASRRKFRAMWAGMVMKYSEKGLRWMNENETDGNETHTQKKEETAAEQQCVRSFSFYFWHTPAFHLNPSEVILFLDIQVMLMSSVLPPISTHSPFPPLTDFTVSARRIWGANNGRYECSNLVGDRRSIVWYLQSIAALNISLQKVKQVKTKLHVFMNKNQPAFWIFEKCRRMESSGWIFDGFQKIFKLNLMQQRNFHHYRISTVTSHQTFLR